VPVPALAVPAPAPLVATAIPWMVLIAVVVLAVLVGINCVTSPAASLQAVMQGTQYLVGCCLIVLSAYVISRAVERLLR
jgi:hypothetical protein